MRKGLKRIALGLVALGLSTTLLLTAAIPVCEAGPDERVVKMGLMAGFTGPGATVTVPWNYGILDYARYINEQGGINGITVEVPWYDTKAFIPPAIIAHRRFVVDGVVLEHLTISSQAETLQPTLARCEIPATVVSALTPPQVSKPQWIAPSFTDWATGFMMTTKWIKETLWTEARPMRVGAVFYDIPSGWYTLEATPSFDKIGAEFVGYEVVPFAGCIDTSVEWLRLANKNPDWIHLTSYGATTVTCIKDAARLGIQEKGIKLVAFPQTLDECTLAIVGKDANGWYSPKVSASYFETEEHPGLKTAIAKAKEYRRLEPEDIRGFYFVGWAHAAVGVEAIRLAIERVGYENLTGRAVRDALFSIKDFDTGVLHVASNISEDTPYMANTFAMYEIREAKFSRPLGLLEPLPSLCILGREAWEKAL